MTPSADPHGSAFFWQHATAAIEPGKRFTVRYLAAYLNFIQNPRFCVMI
jgi:hypothetical protein